VPNHDVGKAAKELEIFKLFARLTKLPVMPGTIEQKLDAPAFPARSRTEREQRTNSSRLTLTSHRKLGVISILVPVHGPLNDARIFLDREETRCTIDAN
jgi:hypothetical protein